MKEDLLLYIRDGKELSHKQQILLAAKLSTPAILAQLTSIVMQYIDAAMVGRLGANESAAIGLVASTTWLFGGVAGSMVPGFTIQLAQAIGAKDYVRARKILRQSYFIVIGVALVLMGIGISIHTILPIWLGGTAEINRDASLYFLVYVCSLPIAVLNRLASGMLSCSGNMKAPGILNSLMCAWDVLFNYLFIFVADMGVMGAALGTALSQAVTAGCLLYILLAGTPILKIQPEERGKLFDGNCIGRAFRLALPIGFEHLVVCGAMVVTTRIVAPLGVIAIAANSFAITAESLCYMPGYGISDAATTLVGQSYGAGRRKLSVSFAIITTVSAMLLMAVSGTIMYGIAPLMIGLLTPDEAVRELGAGILRIEAFAEPFYGASIVVTGALRGAGDTLAASLMNLLSLWFVRIPLSYFLAVKWGLVGVWIAMCLELCFRGIIFLIRLFGKRWMKEDKAI